MSKIFVLGSSGFIGKQLYNYLQVKYSGDVMSSGRNNCDVNVDLAKDFSELVYIAEVNDVVVLLSSISSPDICKNQPSLANKVNVDATIELIEKLTAKGVKVIFTSTDVVFGKSMTLVTDSSNLNPFGDYGDMKARVERVVQSNKLVKVVRFSYVLGKGDKYTSMMDESNNNGEKLEVFDGFERNVIVIDDVIDGIYKLIVNWDRINFSSINFCGEELISRIAMTQLYQEIVSPYLKFESIEAPLGFWNARPKKIEIRSNIFSTLLGRKPKTVEYKFKHWNQ